MGAGPTAPARDVHKHHSQSHSKEVLTAQDTELARLRQTRTQWLSSHCAALHTGSLTNMRLEVARLHTQIQADQASWGRTGPQELLFSEFSENDHLVELAQTDSERRKAAKWLR